MGVESFFTEYLRENGLKVTPERIAILKELLHVPQHFDADEFFLHLKKNKIPVSRATVYRTLDILEKAGIVKKYSMGEAHARFEFVWNQQHHDHLICLQCGKIIEFFDKEIEKRQEFVGQSHKFKILNHSLQIWGLCENCKR